MREINMLDILKSLAPEFLFLVEESSFEITEFNSTHENFGNFVFSINYFDFKVKIYSDRGQRFVDVSCDNEKWHKLEYVLEFINPSRSEDILASPPRFEVLADLMKTQINLFSDFFKSDSYKVFFKKFEMDKNNEVIINIFRG